MNACNEGRIMLDQLEIIGQNTLIQHGKHNDRIYLMKLSRPDLTKGLLDEMAQRARQHKYGKIFCKVPQQSAPLFFANGFMQEAFIPDFYADGSAVFFVSKFLNSDRLLGIETEALAALSQMLSQTVVKSSPEVAPAYTMRAMQPDDVEAMAALYAQVFESYPFPITDPKYLLQTMAEQVQYFGVETEGKLAALASAEMDVKEGNAEMTDFATLPQHAGHGLAAVLLANMEEAMKVQGLKTLYTIARLNSQAMNKTFLRANYQYAGTLINNTQIAGQMESMNIYYKKL